MLTREERIFSELLLARGLVAREFIEGYEKTASRDASEPSLAEVLIDSGALAREQAEEALEEARAIDQALAPHISGGVKLGDFRLLREIGRGGMGIVYEAEQESLGRRVAVKVLPAGAALDERLAIRFLRESRAVAQLRHPGIVQVFASGRSEGVLFFAMELVEGRSLAELVAQGPMEPEQAARIITEVARALDHAHHAELVHRDVKPENILVASDGRARLADFGLVHDGVAASFTLPHHVLGTPSFIAPEQARGEAVDRRSDIYSLGAVLYTLLSGKAPFGGGVPSIILSQVLSGPPPPLASLRPGLAPALIAACERAMARQPADRYVSAGNLADDLDAFLRGEVVPAARVAGRTRRRRWLAGALTSVAAVGVVAAIIAYRTSHAPVPETSAGLVRSMSLFDGSTTPTPDSYTMESDQAEVGIKFRSDSCGYVTGIRFYKDHRNGGQHVGHLWTAAGALLATAVFTNESKDGWQKESFGSPVRIAPDTTYVASFHVGKGDGYNIAQGALANAGIDRGPLHALKDGVDGCNGVAKSGPPRDVGGFPDQCMSLGSHPFVDVVFRSIACSGDGDPSFVLVTASKGSKTWPTLSPDGKHLAYSVCSDGRCDSWLQDRSTGEIVTLGSGRFNPAFGPNGRSMAFGVDGGVDVLDLDGQSIDERTIRHLPAPVSSPQLAWSPQGTLVAFGEQDASKRGRPHGGLFIADVGTRRVRRVSDVDARDLAYSPHGRRIAFVSGQAEKSDLWTVLPDGGDLARLTSDDSSAWSPFWSPDGRRIYFGSSRDGTPRLWKLDVDEASGRPSGEPAPALNVVFPETFYATLSADGGQMAIVGAEAEGRVFRFPFDPSSGSLTAMPSTAPRHPRVAILAQISPDGKRIVYTTAPQYDIAIVDVDGAGPPRWLTHDAFKDVAPRWSPDGERIAFSSTRSGGQEIWTIRSDGRELRRITKTAHGEAGYPAWSPDGKRLAYNVQPGGAFIIDAPAGGSDATPEALPPTGVDQLFEPWSWSPDGTTIAGSVDDVGVLLYSVRNRTYRRITEFGGHPVWLPDGRQLLFVAGRRIHVIGSDGSNPREIYAAGPATLRPFLSVTADGTSIYTSLGSSADAIWVGRFP